VFFKGRSNTVTRWYASKSRRSFLARSDGTPASPYTPSTTQPWLQSTLTASWQHRPQALLSPLGPSDQERPNDYQCLLTPDFQLSYRHLAPALLPRGLTVVVGDSNTHHPDWDPRARANPRGDMVKPWIASQGLHILNLPGSTHRAGRVIGLVLAWWHTWIERTRRLKKVGYRYKSELVWNTIEWQICKRYLYPWKRRVESKYIQQAADIQLDPDKPLITVDENWSAMQDSWKKEKDELWDCIYISNFCHGGEAKRWPFSLAIRET
jgi:hypothetical protein